MGVASKGKNLKKGGGEEIVSKKEILANSKKIVRKGVSSGGVYK